jgi:DNA helicase-2/ATP-dependent DNA helicase PcrA
MVGEEMGGRALSRWHADTEAQGDQVDSAEGDEDMNQDLARLVKGERVVHEMFGAGEVVETSGYGRDVKVTVDFDSVGRKRLLARYAGLERGF